jgi:glutamyl-tRNA synthetase
MVRSRFAPSPTGDLHVGGAWTALAAWALARAAGGVTVLRVEDIDTPRVVRGSDRRIKEDLAWLGLDWDEGPDAGGALGPYVQSERTALYEAALAELTAQGLTYLCDCSRAEIARAASAPHPGEELVYPRSCREASPERALRRPPSVRLRVPAATTISFDDLLRGRVHQALDAEVGDIVLRRGDGVFAYQLVVAADDAAMGITHVLRGSDLLASTPRQLFLMRLLGYQAVPSYAHLPLVVAPDGERLAKRASGATVRALRERGVTAGEIVSVLARGLGLVPEASDAASAVDVARALRPPSSWRTEPFRIPSAWA